MSFSFVIPGSIATLLFAFVTCVLVVINKKNVGFIHVRDMKATILFYLIALLNFMLTVVSVIMIVNSITGAKEYDLLTGVLVLISGIAETTGLLIRFAISKGIIEIKQNTEEVRNNRNSLMANISHEIRTPMNVIVGMTELMKQKKDSEVTSKENLESMSVAAGNLLGVVNNLIDFVKIESDKLDIIELSYESSELFNDIIEKAHNMIDSKSVDFLVEVDPSVPAKLFGDNIRILQAVSNILSNACKFTHLGVITLRISNQSSSGDSVCLRFEIDDTGVGISEENKKYLFGTGGFSSKPNDRISKGAGLGLYITKNIIDKMGGTISIESSEVSGTNVTIVIPQRVIDSTPIGKFKEKQIEVVETKYGFSAPAARVLVVDDNLVNLFVAKELLGRYGMEVVTASGGEECVDLASNNHFDMIFMDYVMPKMDGHETLVKLHEQNVEYLKDVPVIALTAQTSAGGEKEYIDEGFIGFLSKPIDVFELEKILKKFLPQEYICYKDSEKCCQSSQIDDEKWFNRLSSVLRDFDVKKGLESSNNDYITYINLLRSIYNDSFEMTGRLKDDIVTENLEDFRSVAHSLYEATEAAGALKLSFICKEHENAAKNNDFMYIKNHVNTLISEYENFLSQIDILLQREGEIMNKGVLHHKSVASGLDK